MPGAVKRSYDNEARIARSQATRRRILQAAGERFTAGGYHATTVAEIARGARVHVDTVYALVGRKPAILRELIELAISGADAPLEPDEREYVQRIRAEPEPDRKLAIYAAAVRAIQVRLAPLFLALRDASSTEADARAVWQEISERRAANMRRLVAELGKDALRPELTTDDAADTIWATASSELFVLLTQERQWSLERYETWLHDTWRRLLLGTSDAR